MSEMLDTIHYIVHHVCDTVLWLCSLKSCNPPCLHYLLYYNAGVWTCVSQILV